MTMYRQGDLLFEKVADARRLRRVEDGVIARGETTGHAHRVENGTLSYGVSGTMLIDAGPETAVTHEEHDRIELEPGIWLVHRQEEYVAPGETSMVYD